MNTTEFKNQEWLNSIGLHSGTIIKPDLSVNTHLIMRCFSKNPERWALALQWFKTTDLHAIVPGKYEIDGTNLYAIIGTYFTKNPDEAIFESHQKYIDIQYVIEGEELMGLTTMDNASVKIPYNSEKDITFYKVDTATNYLAKPSVFFAFFPENLHQPCVNSTGRQMVKKLVIKVKID